MLPLKGVPDPPPLLQLPIIAAAKAATQISNVFLIKKAPFIDPGLFGLTRLQASGRVHSIFRVVTLSEIEPEYRCVVTFFFP
jgi:hypothetical protein